MFRTACLLLTTLAIGAAAMPALAQTVKPVVRDHTGSKPPAPIPGLPGGQSSGQSQSSPSPGGAYVRDPAQWEIRGAAGIKQDETYAIYNLRRDERDLSSKLAYRESSARDRTGWGDNGGDFIFKRDTAATNVRDHRGVNDGEFVAIYNTKTKRYMKYFGQWDDKPQYIWMVKKQAVNGEGRKANIHFALFNSTERKWLMVCQGEGLKTLNDDVLCLYDDTFKPFLH